MQELINRPRVLVLLAVFDGERFLEQQLDSILAQEDVDVRIVISLDQCNDNSGDLCLRYATNNSNIEILPFGGPFGNAAFNFFHLIQAVNFDGVDFISLSDQDDIWLPDKLSRAAEALRMSGADGYSSSLTAFEEESGRKWPISKKGPTRSFDYMFQGASAGCTYVLSHNAAVLVKERLQGSDVRLMPRPSHDWAIYAICRSFGFEWFIDQSYSGILYRQHSQNFYGASEGLVTEIRKKVGIIRSGWFRDQILYNSRFMRGSKEEQKILSAVDRAGFRDRLWLALRVTHFRRERLKRFGLFALLVLGIGMSPKTFGD